MADKKMLREQALFAAREGRMKTFGQAAARSLLDELEAMADADIHGKNGTFEALSQKMLEAMRAGWNLDYPLETLDSVARHAQAASFGAIERQAWHHRQMAMPLFDAFLALGADPNCRSRLPNRVALQALHSMAANVGGKSKNYSEGYLVEQVEKAFLAGADANGSDVDGRTALHVAAMSSAPPFMFIALLQGGADFNRKTHMGGTAMQFIERLVAEGGWPAIERLEIQKMLDRCAEEENRAPAPKARAHRL
jgi:hypothetical protein